MKKAFLVCFHVLKKSLYPLQDIVQNQYCTEYSYEVPSGSKSAGEGKKDMHWRKWRCFSFCLSGIHFALQVQRKSISREGIFTLIHLYSFNFFFHRKLFSKKLQLLLLEEVEWFKSLMRKRINGPEELKLELRINWFWKIRFKGNIKCSSSRTIKLIVIKWVGIASKVGYFDQISFKFQGVGFEESFSERHQ